MPSSERGCKLTTRRLSEINGSNTYCMFRNSLKGTLSFGEFILKGSSEALDKLGLKRYCCRRMVLTHIDLIEKLLRYSPFHCESHRNQVQSAGAFSTRIIRDGENGLRILCSYGISTHKG